MILHLWVQFAGFKLFTPRPIFNFIDYSGCGTPLSIFHWSLIKLRVMLFIIIMSCGQLLLRLHIIFTGRRSACHSAESLFVYELNSLEPPGKYYKWDNLQFNGYFINLKTWTEFKSHQGVRRHQFICLDQSTCYVIMWVVTGRRSACHYVPR